MDDELKQEIEQALEPEPEQELSLEDIMKEFSVQTDDTDALEKAREEMPIAQGPSLEERLKEFLPDSQETPAQTEAVPADPPAEEAVNEEDLTIPDDRLKPFLQEADEDVKRFVPNTEKAAPAIPGLTIRINPDEIKAAMKEAEPTEAATIRFEPVAAQPDEAVSEDATIPFEPVAADSIPEGAEPFSSGWEPQYETPMGEYVPPEPIVFRPRSRLHELKRKLIAGPERRYYALAEQGLGKLQAAIFLSLLIVILSFAAIAMHSLEMVQDNRMRLLVFGELFAMLLSALLGSHQILDGFASIFKGKFTPDTILGLSFLVCIADGVFCLREVRVPFCAAFCLEVTMSLIAEYQRRNTEMGQMDTLRKATRLNRVAKAPNCYEGRPGFYVTEGEVEDFMDTYDQPTAPQKMLSVYCLIAFLATAAIAAVAGVTKGVSIGLQTWSAALLAAMPATAFICQSRPAAVLERRFHKLGVVLCGWAGVKEMSVAAAIPLTDTVLFPAGSMKINGVKFYSRRDPDQVVSYAAAILNQTNNALTPLFAQLLDSRNGIHYEADTYRSYETCGAGGEVCGESVLLGTAQFLQDMGVDIPEGTRVNQAVYVAVDGELCGVFALAFGKLKGVSAGLGNLCSYRGLTPVMTSDNFLLSEGFLRSKFSVNTRRIAFPTGEERQVVACWTPSPEESVPCALTTQDGLAPMAFAITGARTLQTACNLGTVVHMLAGIVGMIMVLVLTVLQAETLLTPANLLLFHLVWCVPGILITSWARHI